MDVSPEPIHRCLSQMKPLRHGPRMYCQKPFFSFGETLVRRFKQSYSCSFPTLRGRIKCLLRSSTRHRMSKWTCYGRGRFPVERRCTCTYKPICRVFDRRFGWMSRRPFLLSPSEVKDNCLWTETKRVSEYVLSSTLGQGRVGVSSHPHPFWLSGRSTVPCSLEGSRSGRNGLPAGWGYSGKTSLTGIVPTFLIPLSGWWRVPGSVLCRDFYYPFFVVTAFVLKQRGQKDLWWNTEV